MANLKSKVSELESRVGHISVALKKQDLTAKDLLKFVLAAESSLRKVRSHVRTMARKELRSDCIHPENRVQWYTMRIDRQDIPTGDGRCRDCGHQFKLDAADRQMYVMKLESVGNPDFSQYAPVSEPEIVRRATLREMAEAAEEYRDRWNLGGGNWVSPTIMQDGRRVARISYNGRVWDPSDEKKEIAV